MNDTYCREEARAVGKPGSLYLYDKNGVLTRQARIYDSLQQIVRTSLHVLILYFKNDLVLARHHGERRLQDTLRRKYRWHHMANDAYTKVSACKSCAAIVTGKYHQKQLRLFPVDGPFEFLAMDIMGP